MKFYIDTASGAPVTSDLVGRDVKEERFEQIRPPIGPLYSIELDSIEELWELYEKVGSLIVGTISINTHWPDDPNITIYDDWVE